MITSIIRHELRRVLCNSKTWYCLATVQALLAIIFSWLMNNFLKNQAIAQAEHYGITEEVIHPFYAWFALLTLLLLPMLSAQMFTSEKQNGTIVNYYCAPLSSSQVTMAKFYTLIIFLFSLLILVSIMPLSIAVSGTLDWGQYCATLLGVFLMLCAATAVCLSLSASMSNVVRANLIMFVVLAAFILIEWAAQYTGRYAIFLQGFGLLKPLKGFVAGIINLRSLAYYSFIILTFLTLSSWSYARGRKHD